MLVLLNFKINIQNLLIALFWNWNSNLFLNGSHTFFCLSSQLSLIHYMAHVVASTHSYAHEYSHLLIDNILQKKQTDVRKKREDIDFLNLETRTWWRHWHRNSIRQLHMFNKIQLLISSTEALTAATLEIINSFTFKV